MTGSHHHAVVVLGASAGRVEVRNERSALTPVACASGRVEGECDGAGGSEGRSRRLEQLLEYVQRTREFDFSGYNRPELLVAPEDENVDDAADDEKDLIGRGVDPGSDGLSAEEPAVHVGNEG